VVNADDPRDLPIDVSEEATFVGLEVAGAAA
jgi:hypothetical protein